MAIKIFHTSDWHLGKKLYKTSRIPEQRIFLEWILSKIKDNDIDILIIAGDIFDTPIPPTEALSLYFDFLKRLIDETKCNTYIVAGNHDSGKFLEAPKSILPLERITIVGDISGKLKYQYCKDSDVVDLTLIPYFRSYELFNLSSRDGGENEEIILSTLSNLIKNELPVSQATTRILVAHHLFGDFFSEGSEQSLSLSGLETLPLSLFHKQFDYIALGHIHKPQKLSEKTYYSGSPIPFRFSEKSNKKLLFITCQQKKIETREIPIPQSRLMESILCDEKNFTKKISSFIEKVSPDGPSALLEVKMKLDKPQNSLIDQVRQLLRPHNIELLAIHTLLPTQRNEVAIESPNKLNLIDQFKAYHKMRNPDSEAVSPKMLDAFQNILDLVQSGGSE